MLIAALVVASTVMAYGEKLDSNLNPNKLRKNSLRKTAQFEETSSNSEETTSLSSEEKPNDNQSIPENAQSNIGLLQDADSVSDSENPVESETTEDKDEKENQEKQEQDQKEQQEESKKKIIKSTGLKSPLLSGHKTDKSYKKRVLHLSDKEREMAERLVYGEAGHHGFKSMCLVAQCLKDACFKANTKSVSKIRRMYRYNASIKRSSKLSRKAVQFIFEEGGYAVKHRIMYFYLPAQGRSPWHETMNFVVQYKGLRFFDRKSFKMNRKSMKRMAV